MRVLYISPSRYHAHRHLPQNSKRPGARHDSRITGNPKILTDPLTSLHECRPYSGTQIITVRLSLDVPISTISNPLGYSFRVPNRVIHALNLRPVHQGQALQKIEHGLGHLGKKLGEKNVETSPTHGWCYPRIQKQYTVHQGSRQRNIFGAAQLQYQSRHLKFEWICY